MKNQFQRYKVAFVPVALSNHAARRFFISSSILTAVGSLASTLLVSCGGGANNAAAPGSSAVQASPTSIGGTVATGNPVSGANVQIIDVNGKTVSATADKNGNYTASLSGLSAPLLVVANDPNGVAQTLFSVLAALPSGSAPAVANATTLTTALSAMLTPSGNPADLLASGGLSKLATASAANGATATLNTAMASILSTNGLNAAQFDPVTTAFTADQTGQDAAIDAVQVLPASGGGLELISSADPSTAIVLNQSTSVTSPLTVPPAAANYLSSLTPLLGQCLNGTSASCAQAVDSKYLENGYSSFAAAHPGSATGGVTLGYPKTLRYFSSNGVQKALVALPFERSNGTTDSLVTVVQRLNGGTWNVIGNQQQFDISIRSMLERRVYLDANDAPYSRYDAGLVIDIPVGGNNPTNLASASVTGPGINATAWLLPRDSVGTGSLALSSHLLTAPPTGGLKSLSNTSLYRWSWQALPGASGTYVPTSDAYGYATPAPIDTSKVQPYAVYTVTFYDSNGTQLGQPVSVTNPTAAQSASNGSGVLWQTLSQDTINAFFSSSGSAGGAQTQVSAQWSNMVNGSNVAPLVTSVELTATPGTSAASTTTIDGWWNGPATYSSTGQYSGTATAGLDDNGVAECTGCQFPAFQAGGNRILALNWALGKTQYFNVWKSYD